MRIRFWQAAAAALLAGVSLVSFSGCGVSDKQLADAKLRIDSLRAVGVPDTMLDDASLLLSQIPATKKYQGGATAKRQADSMFASISAAEQWVAGAATTLKPKIAEMRAAADAQKKGLSGEQLKVADSCLAAVDAMVNKGWVTQAHQQMVYVADSLLPALLADEKKAAELRPKVIGAWVEVQQAQGKGLSGTEKKSYAFKADGTFEVNDVMKGKTREDLQEDWQFIQTGTWVTKGDTVLLNVKRDQCTRMVLQHLVKGAWTKEEKPAYDSTITDGRKDMALPWKWMEEFLKKGK